MSTCKRLFVGLCIIAGANSTFAQEDPGPDQGLTWSDLIGSDSTFKLYGFIRLDAMFNDSRFNDPLIPVYVQSEDPAAPPAVGASKDDAEFAMSARLTRLGLTLDCKSVPELGDAKLGGKIEGWVPLDMAVADILVDDFALDDANRSLVDLTVAAGYGGPDAGLVDYYFGNLDARRVTWNRGRDLALDPEPRAGRLNALPKAHVEVDGQALDEKAGWTRKLTFVEQGE